MAIDRIEDRIPDPPFPAGFLAGRTALVTGAGRRIGRALALALAGQGAAVVLHYRRSQEEAEAAAARIRDTGGRAELVSGDLTDPTVCEGLPAAAAEQAGLPIDILVNNASVFEPGSVAEADCRQWDRHQDVNLRAPFLLARAFAAELGTDRRGDILNLNDFRAVRPGADHFCYTISKAGLHGLTRSLALALAPRIRVNELALGAVLPPEGADAEYQHTLRREIPTGEFPSLRDVVRAGLFLLGSSAVTGQTIHVDGGRHLA